MNTQQIDNIPKHTLSPHKRNKMVKQLVALANELGQDLYLCLHDRKSDAVTQFSSRPDAFRLENITALASKTATVHKAEKFASKLNKLQEARASLQENDAKASNEETYESKKETVASTTPLELSIVPMESRMESGSSPRYTQIKSDFDIFDQKSQLALGEHKLGGLLKPQSLMCMDLPNEQSYQEQRNTLFGDINQVSYNSRDDSYDISVQDDDESIA